MDIFIVRNDGLKQIINYHRATNAIDIVFHNLTIKREYFGNFNVNTLKNQLEYVHSTYGQDCMNYYRAHDHLDTAKHNDKKTLVKLTEN